MKPNKKEMYISPEAKTFEVKTDGVICISGEIEATMGGPWEEEIL